MQQELGPTAQALPYYPYAFTRAYLCGHPNEHIRVERLTNGRIAHVLLPTPTSSHTASSFNKKGFATMSFTLEKCKACATEKRGQSNWDTARSQGIPKGEEHGTGRKGNVFEDVLERYKNGTALRRGAKWHRETQESGTILHEKVHMSNGKTWERALKVREDDFERTLERLECGDRTKLDLPRLDTNANNVGGEVRRGAIFVTPVRSRQPPENPLSSPQSPRPLRGPEAPHSPPLVQSPSYFANITKSPTRITRDSGSTLDPIPEHGPTEWRGSGATTHSADSSGPQNPEAPTRNRSDSWEGIGGAIRGFLGRSKKVKTPPATRQGSQEIPLSVPEPTRSKVHPDSSLNYGDGNTMQPSTSNGARPQPLAERVRDTMDTPARSNSTPNQHRGSTANRSATRRPPPRPLGERPLVGMPIPPSGSSPHERNLSSGTTDSVPTPGIQQVNTWPPFESSPQRPTITKEDLNKPLPPPPPHRR